MEITLVRFNLYMLNNTPNKTPIGTFVKIISKYLQLTREVRLGGGVLAVALDTGLAAGVEAFATALDLDGSTLGGGGGGAGVRVER